MKLTRLLRFFVVAATSIQTVMVYGADLTASISTPNGGIKEVGTQSGEKIWRVGFYFSLSANDEQFQSLKKHLEDLRSYTSTNDWPSNENTVSTDQDAPAFRLISATLRREPPGALLVLEGLVKDHSRGSIRITQPNNSDWKINYDAPPCVPNAVDPVVCWYSGASDGDVEKFRAKIDLGFGTGGPTAEFSGSGIISGSVDGSHFGATITTLSIAGRFSLTTPTDVSNTPGASRDASSKISDIISVDLNRVHYSADGGPERYGLRARVTGTGRGLEVVSYMSPFIGWTDNSRLFYGAEIEGGYRKGDAEFTSLVTRSPDQDHLALRAAALGEWAPSFWGINKNLREGLRFFVRGRTWLDLYNKDDGSRAFRLRPYFDSELFYNFSDKSRVFIRYENGYLPPDLSLQTKRIYLGVGAAF